MQAPYQIVTEKLSRSTLPSMNARSSLPMIISALGSKFVFPEAGQGISGTVMLLDLSLNSKKQALKININKSLCRMYKSLAILERFIGVNQEKFEVRKSRHCCQREGVYLNFS